MTKFIAFCLIASCVFAILFAENRFIGNVTGQWTFGVLLAISWISACVAMYSQENKRETMMKYSTIACWLVSSIGLQVMAMVTRYHGHFTLAALATIIGTYACFRGCYLLYKRTKWMKETANATKRINQ